MIEYFKKGSGIHIKPENKGKFTEYKKRTGKTTEECLHSKNAHVRQMANFARNSVKWKHEEGTKLIPRNKSGNITSFKGIATGNGFTVDLEYKLKTKLKKKHEVGGIIMFKNPSRSIQKSTEPSDNTLHKVLKKYKPKIEEPLPENLRLKEKSTMKKVDDFVNAVELVNDAIGITSGVATVVAPNPATAGTYIISNWAGVPIDVYQGTRALLDGNYRDATINAGEVVLGIIGAKAVGKVIKPKRFGLAKNYYNGVPLDVVLNLTARALPATVVNTGVNAYLNTKDE